MNSGKGFRTFYLHYIFSFLDTKCLKGSDGVKYEYASKKPLKKIEVAKIDVTLKWYFWTNSFQVKNIFSIFELSFFFLKCSASCTWHLHEDSLDFSFCLTNFFTFLVCFKRASNRRWSCLNSRIFGIEPRILKTKKVNQMFDFDGNINSIIIIK